MFEKVHQHKRIYHRGNIKLNVWWESYFYPRKLLFAAIKEITILFPHWEKLWKPGEEDWQTRGVAKIFSEVCKILQIALHFGYEQEFIKDTSKSKTQGRFLLSYKNPDFFSGLSEFFRIFSKMTEFMGVEGFFVPILFVYMLHGRPHLHGRKQWHMRYKRSHH